MNMKRDETPRDIPRDTPHHQMNNNNNRCRLHRHQDEGEHSGTTTVTAVLRHWHSYCTSVKKVHQALLPR